MYSRYTRVRAYLARNFYIHRMCVCMWVRSTLWRGRVLKRTQRMAFLRRLVFLSLLLWTVAGGEGQDVFLERPESQRVELNATARLNCTANDTTAASVQWWRGGSAVTAGGRVMVDQGALLVARATWSDIGKYTCNITFRGNTYSASATLNITGYVKPFVAAEEGVSTFTHVVGEEQKIKCPVAGNPGPNSYYWQYNTSAGDIANVTNNVSMEESGVFVDSQGQLDVSRIVAASSELFVCGGADVVGNTASTRIRVISVDPEEGKEDKGLDPLEWYFILAYCVVGVLIVPGVVVVVVVCWLGHDQCCDRVAQKIHTRVRVRRSKVNLDDIPVTSKP